MRDLRIGESVVITTTSGREIVCGVVGRGDLSYPDETWLLDSPEHGYVVARHRSEIKTHKELPE